jgi:aminopeptidase-like protein
MNNNKKTYQGEEMYSWMVDLFPICRSITGPGVRETLNYISKILPEINILEIPTGEKVLDWVVPEEWIINEAWIKDSNGNIVVDFKNNNLHVVGYSDPVDSWHDLDSLKKNLHTIPEQQDAIPYVTSYYNSAWGFCLSYEQFLSLGSGKYHAYIDSEKVNGVLNYAEFVLQGKSKKEVLISTYICHPSMANNELSGPVLAISLARWLKSYTDRRYTYRFIFVPETIGSIVYISKNYDYLKNNVIAGYNLTCVGDNRCYSYLPSRNGNTLSDRAAKYALERANCKYIEYSWLDRGSDERQYCAPGIDLPIASIMRSKYGEYPEYHTSKDNLEIVSPEGLAGSLNVYMIAISAIEDNILPIANILGEPQLGRRGLYPSLSCKKSADSVALMMDLLTYSDGSHDLLSIAKITKSSIDDLLNLATQLESKGLLVVNR